MKRTLPILFFLFALSDVSAQSIYDVSLIPAALKKNANTVIRESIAELDIRSTDKIYYKERKVVTVLNNDGSDELVFTKYADRFSSYDNISVILLDALGNKIHKYNKSDMLKQALGEGLVPDGKMYYLHVNAPSFPITIITEFEVKYTGSLNYPGFNIQFPGDAIEHSTLTARVPADLDIRYKKIRSDLNPVITDDGKYRSYTWEIKDQPALLYEDGAMEDREAFPQIQIAPTRFEVDGYAGDMTSWQEFGNWYASLAKDASNLSEERRQFFQSLVKNAKDDRDKIKMVYAYLQENCRYVSIQLGIGGFKPFEAGFVDKNKYGDCKALSNYTQACLSAVGIKSYQALINAGYNSVPVDPQFPINRFNHVILCVPMKTDSMWLECTSKTIDGGVLGGSTENRNALLITENGGVLVPTPKSRSVENIFASHSVVNLKEDGTGSADVVWNVNGEFKQMTNMLSELVKDDQKSFVINSLGYAQPDKFDLKLDKNSRNSSATLFLEIEKIPEFTAGSKMFLNPRIYKLWKKVLPKADGRTQDYHFPFPMVKSDTTVYRLPEGFEPENLPKPRNLSFEYGSFTSNCVYNKLERTVTTSARLVLEESLIPPAKYASVKKFFDEVLADNNDKVVIKHM